MKRPVLIVAVSYFGTAELPDLIDSLVANTEPDWQLLIVDNSADAGEWARVKEAVAVDARVRAVRASSNLGYFGGARRALDEADASAFSWVVVSNVDLRFATDFVARLRARGPDGVVAPSIVSSASGRDQNPYLRHRPGPWAVRRWRWEFALVPVGRLVVALGNVPLPGRRRQTAREASAIYAPHGSCIAFSRRFFEAGGSLDHEPFLFGEEITIGEACRRIGVTVTYDPAISVIHREHASTGTWRSAQMIRWQREAIAHAARLLADEDPVS